ncbi:MAG TPA: MFS transporter [Acetobacteraceae bacterium]|jgi:MFS family permease
MALSRSTRVNILIGNGHFLSHFYSLCLPPLFLAWQANFHISFAELGLAVTLMSVMAAALQTPIGFLVDRYGARTFLIGGTLLMSLSLALMGLATSFWQILLLAPLSGIGNAVFHPADYAIISGSIDRDRMGRAFSWHTFSGTLGFAAGPPVMALLIATIGWRAGVLAVGLLGVPVAISILLQSSVLKDQARHEAHREAPAVAGHAVLLSRTMLLFFGFYLLGSMAGSGLQAWLITVLHTVKGIELAAASAALTAYMLGIAVGVLAGGWFADGHRRLVAMIAVAAIMTSAGLLVLVDLLPLPWFGVIGLMLVAGLAGGCSRTPRDVMLKDASPPGQIGKVFGFVSAGLPLGSALTPVPFGFLIDQHHPELVLILVAAILLGSLACMAGARMSAREVAVAVAAE